MALEIPATVVLSNGQGHQPVPLPMGRFFIHKLYHPSDTLFWLTHYPDTWGVYSQPNTICPATVDSLRHAEIIHLVVVLTEVQNTVSRGIFTGSLSFIGMAGRETGVFLNTKCCSEISPANTM